MRPKPPPPPGPPPEPPVGAYDPTLEGPPPPYPGEPLLPPEEPPPERDLWPWLLALAIVVLGGLAALIFFLTHHHHHRRTVTVVATRTVPSVVSLPRAEAVRRITGAGFNAQIGFAVSSRPKGMVIAQVPEGGAKLSQGSAVSLTVSGGKPKLVVPDVVGLSAQAATKRLQAAGLRSRELLVFSSEPRGHVVSQSPAANTGVAKGATVALRVSKGPQRVAVPNVVGRRRDDAVAALRKAGLVAAVFSVPSSSPRGFVVAQNPQAGTKAPSHSRVRLNVSKGAPAGGGTATTTPTSTTPTTTAAATVRVPKVVGLSQTAAQRRLHAAGFVVRTAYVSSTKPQGTVVAQRPTAGTTLRRGAQVRINVSTGSSPKPATAVPDVTGEDQATATSDLQAAGFRVSVVDQPTSDQNEDGIVLDEDPVAGTRIPAGSLVTIYVGRFTG